LGTSVLVQYGPVPTHLVWWLLLGTFLAAIPGGRDAGAGNRAPRRPGLAAAGRQRAALGPRHLRTGRTLPGSGVGAGRLLPVTGTLASRAVVRLTQPAVGRRHHLLAHRPGRGDLVRISQLCPARGDAGRLPWAAGRRSSDGRRDRGQHARAAAARYRDGRPGLLDLAT
jgi:hypothetical protein